MADPSQPAPWFADGLRFECQPDCGACCSNHDDYSYVYLESGEAKRMAAQLELPLEDFLERYTDFDQGFLILKMDEPDCPLLDGNRCSVYEARPVQCSTFPFWEENLAGPARWSRLKAFCPGIDKGKRHPLALIRQKVDDREA